MQSAPDDIMLTKFHKVVTTQWHSGYNIVTTLSVY